MAELGFHDLVRSIHAGTSPPAPYDAFAGARIERLGPDDAVVVLETGPKHHNPGGVVHGGILYGLADSAMAYAASSRLGRDETCTSIEGHVRFLRPALRGRLAANAKVVKAGRTLIVLECEVRGADGEVVARMSSSFLRMRSTTGPQWGQAKATETAKPKR